IAADPKAPVFVVEGEKCADAVVRLGGVATTSGSASSDGDSDWTPLGARACYLWADNDDNGRAYMGGVAQKLLAQGCAVELVDIEALGLSPKGDVVDWLEGRENATLDDLLALERVRAHLTQSDAATDDSHGLRVNLIQGDTIVPQPVHWLWDGWLASGKLHVIAGRPGAGKTTLALAMAATGTIGGCWPDGSRAEVSNVLI